MCVQVNSTIQKIVFKQNVYVPLSHICDSRSMRRYIARAVRYTKW